MSPITQKQCDKCFRLFSDQQCFDVHVQHICSKSWKCLKCERLYPYKRSQANHICYEFKCRVCSKWVVRNHLCFIEPKQAKAVVDPAKLRFFDFESDISQTSFHIPNLAVVSSNGVDFTVYENEGKNVIDLFCEGEFVEKNKGCTYIAHNAKHYDAIFIRESLQRCGIRFDFIPNGRKLMELRIPALRIRIIDSLNFIQAKLADFPKMFGLSGDSARKGTYPYEFNTLNNWAYCEKRMPELQMFLPGGSHGVPYKQNEELTATSGEESRLYKARASIAKWWKEKVLSGYVWDNHYELLEYCKTDVRILALGKLVSMTLVVVSGVGTMFYSLKFRV